jgi:hypothetical protein
MLGVSPEEVEICDFKCWLPSSFCEAFTGQGTGRVSGLMIMRLVLHVPEASKDGKTDGGQVGF